MYKSNIWKKIAALPVLLLAGCARMPDGIVPVEPFELERYLGHWYEIARLDHSFERGLSEVTAHYSLREDGLLRVVNRGYDQENERWKQAEGRAKFANNPNQAFLRVSFFRPFYGSYVVFALDKQDYSYALVSGPNRSYLWILARQPVLSEKITTKLVDIASKHGFATNELIFVEHGATQ